MADGRYISEQDWPVLEKLLSEFRANGQTLRRERSEPARRTRQSTFYIGKPASDFTAGVLSAPDNVVDIYRGPAWAGEDETNDSLDADYAYADVTEGQWVAVTRYRGKWYVTPLECP